MTFAEALKRIRFGGEMWRRAWEGQGRTLWLWDTRTAHYYHLGQRLGRVKNWAIQPCGCVIVERIRKNDIVEWVRETPWSGAEEDIRAEDWEVRTPLGL